MLEMMNLEELMVARGIELDIHQLPTTQDERKNRKNIFNFNKNTVFEKRRPLLL